ncbi:hypothetical protein LCL95_01670 [Bacillus timonensis]|nr:hypothetical protein [Bacillus timonensis]
MQAIFPVVFLLLALKFGKWKRFSEYYPTLLFMIMGNLLYSFMFKEYPLWRFEHTFEKEIMPTRMTIDLLKTFTSFPLLTFIFLSHFPEGKSFKKQGVYIIFWTFIFVMIEFFAKLLGMISYHNGWNMWWSIVFDFSMFVILSIHFKRPLVAWVLSSFFVAALWFAFDIHFGLLK